MKKVALGTVVVLLLLGVLAGCGKGKEGDTTPPVISAAAASSITTSAATITWTTDEPATNQVEYGLTTSYGSTTPSLDDGLDVSLVTSHSVSLSSLSVSTSYHYRMKSKDASGNEAVSGDYTFTTATPDTTAPAISAVATSTITTSAATITWTTDEAATSQVEYGLTTSYGSTTTLNTNLVTSHSVSLSSLSVSTSYHYRVKSKDASDNEAVSGDYTFTTATPDTTAPAISAVAASTITTSAATITWTTDEAATSQVEYGQTTSYGSTTTLNTNLVTSHTVTLTGLTSGTTYHYRVKSKDAAGNEAISGDETFATSELPDTTPPTISGVSASGFTTTTATITWTTNEPATSQVEYGLTTSYGSSSVLDNSLVTSHSVNLSGLIASTTYHYRVISKDSSDNGRTSGDFGLTTLPNTVVPPTSITTTVLSNTTIALGGNVTDAATITTSTGPGATGTVDFQWSTDHSTWTTFSTKTLSDSSATSISYTPATAGTYYFRAVYSGDANYSGSQSGNTDEPLTVTTTQLVVRYINVGQGDSILVDYGTYEMLIDGWPGPTNVASYIKPYVDGPLDVVVATHPDADHIKGLIAVLSSFTIGQIWTDGQATTTQTYTQFTNAVQTNGAPVHTGRRGDTIDLGGLTFHVLNPTGITGTTNNDSIVLELDFGQVDFLFEGDAEQEAEASMIAAGLIHHVDIVKIGHHGSDTASSAAFVNATTPEVAIYSCAMVNPYGHPAASTIARWQNAGATVYGTNVNGTITVTTNGTTYNVEPTNQVPPISP